MSRTTTAAAIHGVRYSSVSPPTLSMSRISSVAYAFEESGSLQNTGSASFFGSNVSPIMQLRRGRPTSSRLGIPPNVFTNPAKPAA